MPEVRAGAWRDIMQPDEGRSSRFIHGVWVEDSWTIGKWTRQRARARARRLAKDRRLKSAGARVRQEYERAMRYQQANGVPTL
jgi:hypothetical protein